MTTSTPRAFRLIHPRAVRVVANTLLLVFLLFALREVLTTEARQGDVLLCRYAVKTWQAGGNPYDAAAITRTAGTTFGNSFVYPPDILPLFTPFTWFGTAGVGPVYLAFQCLLFASLLVCWGQFFLQPDDRTHPLFFLLCLFGFNQSLLVNLSTGSTTLVEAALLWWGLAAWLRGRYVLFAVLLWLASACRLTPLAFSVLLLLPPARRWGLFVLVWVTMAARLGLDRWWNAPLFHDFTTGLAAGRFGGTSDGGRNNPCLLEALRSVWYAFDNTLDQQEMSAAVLPVYAVIVLVVLAASWFAWRAICRRYSHDDFARGVRLVSLTCLVYALTAPRMKDYSYILLLPAAWQVGKSTLTRWPHAWFVGVVCACLSNGSYFMPMRIVYEFLWEFFAYVSAAVLWGLLLWETFAAPTPTQAGVTALLATSP